MNLLNHLVIDDDGKEHYCFGKDVEEKYMPSKLENPGKHNN